MCPRVPLGSQSSPSLPTCLLHSAARRLSWKVGGGRLRSRGAGPHFLGACSGLPGLAHVGVLLSGEPREGTHALGCTPLSQVRPPILEGVRC